MAKVERCRPTRRSHPHTSISSGPCSHLLCAVRRAVDPSARGVQLYRHAGGEYGDYAHGPGTPALISQR